MAQSTQPIEYLHCRKCRTDRPGVDFYRKKGKIDTAWCKLCYREWHRGRYVPENGGNDNPRECAQCGVVYQPKQRNTGIYCSRKCKHDARNAKTAAALLATKSPRECLHCAVVIPASARSDAIFCSVKCNESAHALQRKLRTRTHGDKPGYLRAAVCERDLWRCGICLQPVDRKLEHPDLMCPSLDHIIPVSHGGDNALSNLQLTHLVCNLRRRNLPLNAVRATTD